MGIGERLRQSSASASTSASAITSTSAGAGAGRRTEDYQRLKGVLHGRIIEQLDLEALGKLPPEALRAELAATVTGLIAAEDAPAQPHRAGRARRGDPRRDRRPRAARAAARATPTVTDILVNRLRPVYVERAGRLERTQRRTSATTSTCCRSSTASSAAVGRRVDETSPDGRRAPARRLARERHHPAAGRRRARSSPSAASARGRSALTDLIALGTLTPADGDVPRRRACAARMNIAHLRRHRLRQDHAAQRALRRSSPTTSASSPSRTRPSCSCSSRTWCAWRRARRTSRARARCRSATWCATRCACGPTASSSARSAAPRSSTCCRR